MSAIQALDEEEAYLAALMDDPSGIDLAECFFTDDTPGRAHRRWRLWDFQWDMYQHEETYQSDLMARSMGKALALTTPIPTPDGWTTMGALTVGDVIFDEKGLPTTVITAFEVNHGRPCYEVEFGDGEVIVADEGHLWETWDKRARSARNRGRLRIAKSAVRTTAEIADTLKVGRENNHSIPLAGPLACVKRELPLDPYYLGIWLGDGTSRCGHITSADDEVVEELRLRGFVVTKLDAKYAWSVTWPGVDKHSWKTSSVSARLRVMGLLQNKHIPHRYLRADEKARRDLLAGLMDSDGHLTEQSYAELTQKSERIARDLMELLRGLGEKPIMRKKTARIDGVDCGPVFRVRWKPVSQPAKLARKATRFVPSIVPTKHDHRIVDVRPTSSVPVRCIVVDSPNHLFLAGESMIPTHNSVGIIMRASAFPVNFPGQEMLITAPELNHLGPIVDKVEEKFKQIRFLKEMLPNIKGGGIKHQPQFQATFINGSRIMGRLPQRTGVGVKGQHPLVIEQDEGQDYPGPGWVELIETMKTGIPGAQWRVHGVSNGVRDMYYNVTSGEGDLPFYVHKYPAMYRPTWSDEERKAKIAIYGGSRDNPDYKRNIYGEPGDVSNKVFVLARLMGCTRINESSWATDYNENIYTCIKVEGESLENRPIESFIKLPASHLHKSYSSFWAGMDLGFTNDPSELLIFGVIRQKRNGEDVDVLRLLTRIHLMRVTAVDQEKVIAAVFGFYGERLRALSLDKTGAGLPIWQHMDDNRALRARIKGYGFSEKKAVAFDDRPLVGRETPEDAVIEKNIIEFATDKLREFVDAQQVELPYDKELLTEFQGQVVVYSRESNGSGGRRTRYGGGSFHTLDAAKLMVLGKELEAIELALAPKRRRGPVLDGFIG